MPLVAPRPSYCTNTAMSESVPPYRSYRMLEEVAVFRARWESRNTHQLSIFFLRRTLESFKLWSSQNSSAVKRTRKSYPSTRIEVKNRPTRREFQLKNPPI